MDSPKPEHNYWSEFGSELMVRLLKPWKHPTFVMYFLGIIVILGGFGIAEPMMNCWVFGKLPAADLPKAIVSAAYTYFVAIAATAAVDLILAYRQRKYLLMFFVLALLIVLLCAIVSAGIGTVLGKPQSAAVPAVIGYVLALVLWWVGNANNSQLLDTPPPPQNETGGSTDQPLAGGTQGFKV